MKTKRMILAIDNGHGCDTAGKCSPDGSVREWEVARRIARRLSDRLRARGIETIMLVEEDRDVGLSERIRRANTSGADLLISIHADAAGDGRDWHNARGFTAWTARGASADARRLGSILEAMARERGLNGNRAPSPAGCHTADFAILRRTRMPAVLTENLFMDNRADAALLASDEGIERLALLHADAVATFLNLKTA